jgi:RNA polymerase-interacting CarD/CdnL/TRCF family regulator
VVFLASAGVVTVTEYASRDARGRPAPYEPSAGPPVFYVVRNEDVTACVPVSVADDTLRPLIDEQTARTLLDVLRGAEPPLHPEPLLERGKRVVHSGTPREHAELLRELYALPAPLSETLALSVQFVSTLVLGEIAAVLRLDRSALVSEMRTRYPAAADGFQQGELRQKLPRP